MTSKGLHKIKNDLKPERMDIHQALSSLIGELEAVNWHNQCADTCTNKELRMIMEQSCDKKKEQAAMLLEWIRRQDPSFNTELRITILFLNTI